MDSIDLQTLASSLPNAHQQAEAELTNNFKAAALSITTLYRSSKEASKKAHDAGYAKACCDLMQMIQRGVSADGNDMTVGRVMDWLEARLDAVKSRAEEEQEDEESIRRKPHAAPKQQPVRSPH
ncbi:hypothetical protein CYLTODRAFT_380157 [Cylindrobasidium torrendii FP15055 ss-10]|uniref:Uncharacterized protein n=1 Tax=Cylindrobasidium torrendii FP15055 ss-10 TaxID=1314674 RepID=A0A0D7B468_9AGAR|nr:hypothetical protein CYLTODRAFT_380157 [Cylindrobasidium torrendii FP15055 ss-10]